jgi:hypothetical protein
MCYLPENTFGITDDTTIAYNDLALDERAAQEYRKRLTYS